MSLQPSNPSGRTLLAVLDKQSSPTTNTLSGCTLGVGVGVGDRDTEESSFSVLFDRRWPRQTENRYSNPPVSRKACSLRRAPQQDTRRIYRCCRRVGAAGIGGSHLHELGGKTRKHPGKRRNQDALLPSPRRSLSVGDIPCRDHATAMGGRGRGGTRACFADRSLLDTNSGWSDTRGVKSDTLFAKEEVGDWQQKQERRECVALEGRIRQGEKEHERAKVVACQLACRVLCRSHRTRLLANALWRWKAQAAGLKMDQDRRGEQKREQDQVGLSSQGNHTVALPTTARILFFVAMYAYVRTSHLWARTAPQRAFHGNTSSRN